MILYAKYIVVSSDQYIDLLNSSSFFNFDLIFKNFDLIYSHDSLINLQWFPIPITILQFSFLTVENHRFASWLLAYSYVI